MWQERLNEFVTLFVVINPVGVLTSFVATTGGLSRPVQHRIAALACLVAFLVLAFLEVAGGFVLEKMGVSLRAFQIAGGVVLFLIALEMVRGEQHAPPKRATAAEKVKALAIYPIAIPKIVSPGAMLAVVVVGDDDRFNFVQLSLTTAVLAVVLLITLFTLLAAPFISRFIGETGASVISRVLGLILVALAVTTVLNAFGDWLSLPKL
jgi:multiple antibiotic resistance protein